MNESVVWTACGCRWSGPGIGSGVLRSVVSALLGLQLSGCVVGPAYRAPDLPSIDSFVHQPPTASAVAQPSDSEFWRSFGDPLLEQLVDAALQNSSDLRLAYANHQAARAMWRASRAEQLPVITASAEARDTRAPVARSGGVGRADHEEYDVGLGAVWELDFFGRIQRGVEASRADSEADEADFAAAQVAVVGELAHSFLQLRGWQAQLQVARLNAEKLARLQQLLQARLEAGLGSRFDVDRGRVLLEGQQARIPALEAEIAAASNRVAVLSGIAPQRVAADLQAGGPLPASMPVDSFAGTPGDLLRRRPDVRAAERRLAAATARIGVATADLFPRFSLAGLVGTNAWRAGDLFRRDSETRLLVLGVNGSFLNVARVRSQIAAADAVAAGALARYDRAVLVALEETENALVRVGRLERELVHLAQAVDAAVRAERTARIRLEQGAIDLLEFIDVERTRIEVEDLHLQGRRRHAQARVSLFRALAGGWRTVPVSPLPALKGARQDLESSSGPQTWRG